MKIIFFGTSDFAIPSLRKIMGSRHELLAVVTQPDRKKGRKLVVTPPPVKMALEGESIPVHQPKDTSSLDMIDILKRYNPDLFIVIAFGQILRKEVLEVPKLYCVNLHASLLPKYRGAAPINWAIINGDKKTGVTTIEMDEKMDAGSIILKEEVDILDTDTSESLSKSLSNVGAGLLMETIGLIEAKKVKFLKQREEDVTYAYKLKKEDGLIDWSMKAYDLHNRIRGLIPWPGAYTYREGRLIKIWKSAFNEAPIKDRQIGTVLRLGNDGIAVGTGKGELKIQVLQLEGGKRLNADEFLRGHKLKVGDRFE